MIQIAELDVIATVTRSALSTPLAELDLNDEVNYVFGRGLRVGAVTWRREAATSPYVHGRIPVHEVMDAAESTVVVYVMGNTHAALNANVDTLLTAFTQQYEYTLKLRVNGEDYHWRCERADYEVGFVTEALVARFVPVSLSFHRHPLPVQGAF